MTGKRQIKAVWRDPKMRALIDALWREYYALYGEKYDNDPEKWKLNSFSPDIDFGQAIGQDHLIEGNRSIAIGQGLNTKSFMEFLLGSYSLVAENQDPDNWIATDRLLAVGNGTDDENRSLAIEIFKSGLVKYFNAIKLSAYEHGDEVPADGILQFLDKKLELSFEGQWHELVLKDHDHEIGNVALLFENNLI